MASDVADELGPRWDSEEIPADALLYLRVHENNLFEDGTPKPGAFRNRQNPDRPDEEAGMSTYWNRHATPEAVKAQARNPAQNFMFKMRADAIRGIPDQRLKHTPDNRLPENPNRGHSDVFGPKTRTKERLLFRTIAFPV
jgi:hypothetical protein